MLWRFLEGADERLPSLAETKNNLSVHFVGMIISVASLSTRPMYHRLLVARMEILRR
jgi:hypothetical protein